MGDIFCLVPGKNVFHHRAENDHHNFYTYGATAWTPWLVFGVSFFVATCVTHCSWNVTRLVDDVLRALASLRLNSLFCG